MGRTLYSEKISNVLVDKIIINSIIQNEDWSVIEYEESVEYKLPSMVKLWDYIRNKCKPNQVTYGSGVEYWLKCENNHSWLKSPSAFTEETKRGSCPECGRLAHLYPEKFKRIKPENNKDLVEKYKDLKYLPVSRPIEINVEYIECGHINRIYIKSYLKNDQCSKCKNNADDFRDNLILNFAIAFPCIGRDKLYKIIKKQSKNVTEHKTRICLEKNKELRRSCGKYNCFMVFRYFIMYICQEFSESPVTMNNTFGLTYEIYKYNLIIEYNYNIDTNKHEFTIIGNKDISTSKKLSIEHNNIVSNDEIINFAMLMYNIIYDLSGCGNDKMVNVSIYTDICERIIKQNYSMPIEDKYSISFMYPEFAKIWSYTDNYPAKPFNTRYNDDKRSFYVMCENNHNTKKIASKNPRCVDCGR